MFAKCLINEKRMEGCFKIWFYIAFEWKFRSTMKL